MNKITIIGIIGICFLLFAGCTTPENPETQISDDTVEDQTQQQNNEEIIEDPVIEEDDELDMEPII